MSRTSSSQTSSSSSSRNQRTSSVVTEAASLKAKWKKKCSIKKYHFNSMWSLWYCVFATAFTLFLVCNGIQMFLNYASLSWPKGEEPFMELNAHVGLIGAAVVVLPFFIAASVIKIGNLSNDGFKLGSSLSICSRDPPSVIQPSSGLIRNLWMHGVPTSPFLHLIAAFCLLLPQTLMEGALIKANFVKEDKIWRPDTIGIFGKGPVNSTKEQWQSREVDSPNSLSHFTNYPMVLIQGNITPVTNYVHLPQPSWTQTKSLNDFYDNSRNNLKSKRKLSSTGGFKDPSLPFAKTPSKNQERKLLPPFSPHLNTKVEATPPTSNLLDSDVSNSGLMSNSFSLELVNYALALLVFAVRYPSVFWHTNKHFALLFSLHLVITGIQTVVMVTAFSILYKFQMSKSHLTTRDEASLVSNSFSSLTLMVVAVITLTVSSSVIYFYGYQRFAAFLDRSRRRFHITYTNNLAVMRTQSTHLSSLVVFLVLSLTFGPLLWDFSALYRLSGDNKVLLTAIVSSLGYLVLWILFWLYLCVRCSWIFKLRVTVARAFVSSARSIKLVNDIELSREEGQNALMPVLVVGNGRAVAIKDPAPKKAIIGIVNKVKDEKKSKGQEEDIYWLRPSFTSNFDQEKLASKTLTKVTFSEDVEENDGTQLPFSDDEENDEAGDYAILKDSFCPRAFGNSYEIAPHHRQENEISSSTDSSPVLVAPDYEDTEQLQNTLVYSPPHRHQIFVDSQDSFTSRSNRSNDSGMPIETPSQRSDSLSSASSNSPLGTSSEYKVHSMDLNGTRNKFFNGEDFTRTPHDPQQPTVSLADLQNATRHPRFLTEDTTVAIRRNPSMIQEPRPPIDPIYSTRKVSTFIPSEETQSPMPSPVLPMPPLSSLDENGVVGLFPSRLAPSYTDHTRFNPQRRENTYRTKGAQASNAYPQMPLPPIPQGMVTPSNIVLPRNSQSGAHRLEVMGRTHNSLAQSFDGIYGTRSMVPIERSSSLRYSRTFDKIPKQYTNTFPHVLPKDSHCHTNV